MKLYQSITLKQLRKTIKQGYIKLFQDFNRLKIRFNWLFIATTENEFTQTIMRVKR